MTGQDTASLRGRGAQALWLGVPAGLAFAAGPDHPIVARHLTNLAAAYGDRRICPRRRNQHPAEAAELWTDSSGPGFAGVYTFGSAAIARAISASGWA